MIPGPYDICHGVASEIGDNTDFRTLVWGYDTAPQAYAALPAVAAEHKVPPEECIVIRCIEREEAAEFVK